MTPATRIRAIADRWEAATPAHSEADGFTARTAPTMLRRLADKLGSPDPSVVARGAEQLRGVAAGWADKTSPAALLWGEAVAVVGPAPAAPAPAAPAHVHPLVRVMAGAYERGRAHGHNDEQTRILKWLANLRGDRFDGMTVEEALRWVAGHVADPEEPGGPT